MNKLHLIEYIETHPDWQQLLTEKPYCITIKTDPDYPDLYMFCYSQIDSDFYNPIVKECRGIILEINNTITPVCVPFFKFGNYGEDYADTIDWSTAKVQEKVDGSLIKLYYYEDGWKIATNGTIDAYKAKLPPDVNCNFSSYGELFDYIVKTKYPELYKDITDENDRYKYLNGNYTYMFELISPYNRVVVPYVDNDIRFIGKRDLLSLYECDINNELIEIPKPKEYALFSLEECINAASVLPYSQEGYVVVDKDFHRVKIKSLAYVAAHYLKNNNCITYKRIVSLIRQNQKEEFLTYFPEYTKYFTIVEDKISDFEYKNNLILIEVQLTITNRHITTRAILARIAKKAPNPACIFSWLDHKTSVSDWLWNKTDEQICKLIGLKDKDKGDKNEKDKAI